MKAFYFSANNKKLRYGDDRVIRIGRTHKVKGELIMCRNGLHASKRVIDALTYAPGPNLYIVKLGGEIIEYHDKCCASERTYLKHFNAEKLLFEFARKQALINIEKIKPYTDSYDLIVKWLKTGDKNIKGMACSAADSAARSAADSAADSAARSAADSAVYSADSAADSAAYSAARSARSAALSEAYSAADSAAYSAADSAADNMLTEMLKNVGMD